MGPSANAGARHESEDSSDEALIRAAQRDPEAFGLLYERYSRDIEAFIRSRVDGNVELAQDLTSQVFTKAFSALSRFQSGSFRGWLYQIARNTVIDAHRSARPVSSIDAIGERPSGDRSLDEHVVAEDSRAQLHRSLAHLKARDRDIIVLRLHHLTMSEIGARLGMSEEAVKSAQYRALNKLKIYLQGQP